MKAIFSLFLLTGLTVLSSCATTGDPNQGGLFGWSESKAQNRQTNLQNHLQDVQQDTQDQQARTQQLENKKAQLESQQ